MRFDGSAESARSTPLRERFVRRAFKKSSTNSERRGLRRFNARSHYFGTVVFLANNMPQLPPEKIYELWLIPASGAPIPAGVFRPNAPRPW